MSDMPSPTHQGHLMHVAIGLISAWGVLVLSRAGSEFVSTGMSSDPRNHRLAVLGLVVLGVGVAWISIRTRSALAVAVPSAVLVGLYAPMMFGLSFPDWYPDWLSTNLLEAYSPQVPVIIGIFVAASMLRLRGGWLAIERLQRDQDQSQRAGDTA